MDSLNRYMIHDMWTKLDVDDLKKVAALSRYNLAIINDKRFIVDWIHNYDRFIPNFYAYQVKDLNTLLRLIESAEGPLPPPKLPKTIEGWFRMRNMQLKIQRWLDNHEPDYVELRVGINQLTQLLGNSTPKLVPPGVRAVNINLSNSGIWTLFCYDSAPDNLIADGNLVDEVPYREIISASAVILDWMTMVDIPVINIHSDEGNLTLMKQELIGIYDQIRTDGRRLKVTNY